MKKNVGKGEKIKKTKKIEKMIEPKYQNLRSITGNIEGIKMHKNSIGKPELLVEISGKRYTLDLSEYNPTNIIMTMLLRDALALSKLVTCQYEYIPPEELEEFPQYIKSVWVRQPEE